MKKIYPILFVLIVMLLGVSCKKNIENFSSGEPNQKNGNFIDAKDYNHELETYYYENFSDEDIGILADVTKDNNPELITIRKIESKIIGNVYTLKGNKVEMLEEKTGGTNHADNLFNWYLLKKDNTCFLVEETDGMWQGIGKCETVVYTLTSEAKRTVEQTISINSEGEKEVSPADFDNYRRSISKIIGNSYVIRKTISESSVEPLSMDGSFVINTADQPEKNSFLNLGKYTAKLDFSGGNYGYADLILKEGNSFTLEANFELNNFKTKAPFVKNGYYKIQNINNINWITLYIYNEKYQMYAVVDKESFQDQVLVFKYKK